MGLDILARLEHVRRRARRLPRSLSIRSDDRRFLSRAWPLPGGAAVRHSRAHLLARLRAGACRLQRPLWHALEDLGGAARRLCEILRRRKRGERARPRGRGRHERRRKERQLRSPDGGPRAAVVAAGPIANFILAIADLRRHFPVLRQADHQRARRCRAAQQRRRRGRISSRATSFSPSTARRSTASPTCSASSASAPASRYRSRSSAAASIVTLKATPATQGDQGQFRQRPPASACSASAVRWRPATSRRRSSGR